MAEGKRVALYARVSTSDQTPENQLLDLRADCARRGWTIVEEFVDAAFSGSKADRPALQRVMEAARKRRVDVVFVWRFDRFARSVSHLVASLEYFRSRGVDFASYSEGIDTATAQGKMVFTIFASIAEFERALIIERIHSGLRRARRCLNCTHARHARKFCSECGCENYISTKRLGRPPGISPTEVARIYELREKGWSIRQIEQATDVRVSRSVIQRMLSRNGIQKVAPALDGTSVA